MTPTAQPLDLVLFSWALTKKFANRVFKKLITGKQGSRGICEDVVLSTCIAAGAPVALDYAHDLARWPRFAAPGRSHLFLWVNLERTTLMLGFYRVQKLMNQHLEFSVMTMLSGCLRRA